MIQPKEPLGFLGRTFHSPLFNFLFFASFTLVLLIFFLQFSYQQTDANVRSTTENEARILANQLDATLRRISCASNVVVDHILTLRRSPNLLANTTLQQQLNLSRLYYQFHEVIGHYVYDQKGKLLAHSDRGQPQKDLSGEDFFLEISRNPQHGLFFTKALTTTPRSMLAYQPIIDGDQLLGLVITAVNLEFFQHLFSQMNVGEKGMVSIRRADSSRLVVRWPFLLDRMNNPAPAIPPQKEVESGKSQGVVRYIGKTDGVDRIFAFQKIPAFPFYVLVGRSYKEQFHSWYNIALITSSLTLFFLLLLGRYLHRLWVIEARLRESRQQYEAILESQNDAVCRWRPDTTLTFTNAKYNELFGESNRETLLGRKWIDLLPEQNRTQILAKHEHRIAEKNMLVQEYSVQLNDGSNRSIHWVDVPLFDDQGKCVEIQSVGRDITDLRQAEQEQKKLARRLAQAQKIEAIGTLAGGIAHDFNNILGSIIGFTEMSLESLPPASQEAHNLKNVLRSSRRAVELVKQILAFSRQSKTKFSTFAPERIVKEALKLLRSTLPASIEISEEYRGKIRSIYADPIQVHQIIVNLCTNAFQAMENKGGKLTILVQNITLPPLPPAREHLEPGAFVEILIRDTGTGIAPEILPRIFDPYFTTKEVGKGTGMGLSIVHGLVSATHGSIHCQSELGQGTTFTLRLPVSAHVEDEDPLQQEELAPMGMERILLVDDEPMLTEALQTILLNMGYDVTAKTNSLEALDWFEHYSANIDLVITDLTMPNLSGMDMARKMLAIRDDIPIILCTGFSATIDAKTAKEAGIRAFFYKPIQRTELAQTIRQIFDEERLNLRRIRMIKSGLRLTRQPAGRTSETIGSLSQNGSKEPTTKKAL